MTVIYSNLCYNEVCYEGIALFQGKYKLSPMLK